MKPATPAITCHLLMTGNELMTGVTIDSNSAYIAEQLNSIGLAVHKMVTVGDSLQVLAREMQAAIAEADILVINGGLGPTVDDLTAEALALTCQQPLVKHPRAETHVRNWCAQRNMVPNEANLKQAILPASARIIPNPVGSAVGIEMTHGKCQIFCTPGVPAEMRAMMAESIIPNLRNTFPDSPQHFIKRLQVFGIGESGIQQKIRNELPPWPEEIELGFRAGMPSLELKLTVYHQHHLDLRDEWEQKVRQLLGSVIFGEESDTLASVVVKTLKQLKQTVTVAESCTGGLIASQITGIPGSSAIFGAGFVTYSNEAKHTLLGVRRESLARDGAVSESVVREMAASALERSGADLVVAVSGIAGPDGGTADKPVGTIWLAWGTQKEIKARKLFYPAERRFLQSLVAAYALDLIRREALGITDLPRYFRQ